MSTEDKDSSKLGEEISRVREFAEDKGLDEETVDDFVKNAIDKHEEASVESWLDRQHAGSGDVVSIEGFLEAAGDVIRNIVRGKKPTFKGLEFKDNSDRIKNTYGNLRWVNSRRLLTGQVKITNGSLLQGDVGKSINKLIHDAKAVMAKDVVVVQKLLKQAQPLIDLLSGSDWKDPIKVSAFYDKYQTLPYKAEFYDIPDQPEPTDVTVERLAAQGVVDATNLIFDIRSVYYGGELNPFSKVDWYNIFYVKVRSANGFNVSETAFGEDDPRFQEMKKHYAGDQHTWHMLYEMCGDLRSFGYGVEYDWSTNSEHGSYELSLYMKALIAHIDASVK